MSVILKVCCDTDTLSGNISEPSERRAMEQLLGRCKMVVSNILHFEVMNTPDEAQRDNLMRDYDRLDKVTKNERFVGIHIQMDRRTLLNSPMYEIVQDEAICAELVKLGLDRHDAEHITQAVCNDCDVFLTRDVKTIIGRYRPSLEQRFPKLRVRKPSELLRELGDPPT
jgi:hypothetical protein